MSSSFISNTSVPVIYFFQSSCSCACSPILSRINSKKITFSEMVLRYCQSRTCNQHLQFLQCGRHLIFFVQKLRFCHSERQGGNQYLILLHLRPVEERTRKKYVLQILKNYKVDQMIQVFFFSWTQKNKKSHQSCGRTRIFLTHSCCHHLDLGLVDVLKIHFPKVVLSLRSLVECTVIYITVQMLVLYLLFNV